MFEVAAESYRRFMGRFSEPLAVVFADQAGVIAGQRVLDVGCGPGALTAELVERLGADGVVAVDPSEMFVQAAQHRLPEVDIRLAAAEELPFADDSFDAALAELVVHFMSDPVAGLQEMGRVTRPGGVIGACVWDYAGGGSPLSTFWDAVDHLDPQAVTEAGLPGAHQGHLVELAERAGLGDAIEGVLTVVSPYESFEEWWEPYTLGVGPAGVYVSHLEEDRLTALREHCRSMLPDGPFEITANAWSVIARA